MKIHKRAELYALWATLAVVGLGVVATYVRFETGTNSFIEHADEWHSLVRKELNDLRRIEIKELAEENDDQQVALMQVIERQVEVQKDLAVLEQLIKDYKEKFDG